MCCENFIYTASYRSHTPSRRAAGTLYIYIASYRSHTPNLCAAGTFYIQLHTGHIHLTRVLRELYIYGFIPVIYTYPACCRNLLYTASYRSNTPNPCAAGTFYIQPHTGHIHLICVLQEPSIYGFISVTNTQPVCCGNLIYTTSYRSHTPNPCAAGTFYIRLHTGHIHLICVLQEPSIQLHTGHIHLTCAAGTFYATYRSHAPNPCCGNLLCHIPLTYT